MSDLALVTACWGVGYAALLVATIAYAWPGRQRHRGTRLVAKALIAVSVLLLWGGVGGQALVGHGWPLVSPADRASAIGLLLLTVHLMWRRMHRETDPGIVVAPIALLLLSYGLGHYLDDLIAEPMPPLGLLLENLLNAVGGSLLALAAACSLASWLPHGVSASPVDQRARPKEGVADGSDTLVRGALLCLAIGLAIDTWWLQKVGLGTTDDTQQAGIAVSWMVYFLALRLRSSPQWRSWPWTAILIAGFFCTLPLLIRASWLGTPLPL